MDSTRVDRWLWAVRIYKTRSGATDACRGGHVTINDAPAKPASTVRVGDRVHAFAAGRVRVLDVVQIVERRVGPPVAATCLTDHSPPVERDDIDAAPFLRARGAGRPTKRQRRQMDRFRGA